MAGDERRLTNGAQPRAGGVGLTRRLRADDVCVGARLVSIALAGALVAATAGCEALQRKFTRRSKPKAPPIPVIKFEDYSKAMTPLDRYRKHYLMFDYWDEELRASLQSEPLNPKRYRHASKEAIGEMETMRSLVTEELAAQLDPLLETRVTLDHTLQQQRVGKTVADSARRNLEQQARTIRRVLYWRNVEDHLKDE